MLSLNQAIKIDPKNVIANFFKIRILVEQNELKLAKSLYK